MSPACASFAPPRAQPQVNANPSRKALAPAIVCRGTCSTVASRRHAQAVGIAALLRPYGTTVPGRLPRDNGWARRLVGKGDLAPTGNANAAAESSLGNCDSGRTDSCGAARFATQSGRLLQQRPRQQAPKGSKSSKPRACANAKAPAPCNDTKPKRTGRGGRG
ncbi:hypothetical protein ERJ75_000401500 [Trypanosoma vivax]|nr:hypothetical protein ERJ75_000401500 [Trypanosoma vivax]